MKLSCLIFPAVLLIIPEILISQIPGCTDRMAVNYNNTATVNDGSCIYNPIPVSPVSGVELPAQLNETSGLIKWNHYIWTHNDDTDLNIYALDTVSGSIVQYCTLAGAVNNDWEEISQDNEYIYIGDFGNNANGNRDDLKILKISKNSILSGPPVIEEISFSYSDQTDLDPAGPNNTDFDCEAFIVSDDSIFLFTKQYISNRTSLYSLPKTPGTFIAKLKATLDVQGLITGAVFLESEKLIVLCGYSSSLDPFLYLLYDFTDKDFFSGNKRKISIESSFLQIEGITTSNGLKYFITNEKLTLGNILTVAPKLQILDLSSYLDYYLDIKTDGWDDRSLKNYTVFPVPADDFISVKSDSNFGQSDYLIFDLAGHKIRTGTLPEEDPSISVERLPSGLYLLKIGKKQGDIYKIVKK